MTEVSPYRFYESSEVGKDGYPPVWHEVLKHEVREQAGHRCVRCGHPYRVGHTIPEWSPCDERCNHGGPARIAYAADGAEEVLALTRAPVAQLRAMVGRGLAIEARWRVLTVHHLDGVKANCRWWNLVALCQRCHLQIQGKVQMARVWPWEHSEWFKPYVAGYYAWTYLDEYLTREQAEARMDELLALEKVA